MKEVPESAEIRLGERIFTVKSFELDELQPLLNEFRDIHKPVADGGFLAARKIVERALASQIEADELGKLHCTVGQVLQAAGIIADVSGLTQVGEAVAQMSAASQPTG